MNEWEDIIILGHDKRSSISPRADDDELRRQAFELSELPPAEWVAHFNGAASASPGRQGRVAKAIQRRDSGKALLFVHGGPNIFDQRDADHLKTLVAFANDKYRESLKAMDLSGLDAFG